MADTTPNITLAFPDGNTRSVASGTTGMDVAKGINFLFTNGGIAVGSIRADGNNPRAFWMWLVADNVRVAADSAVEAMKAIDGKAAGGKS